MAKGNSILKQRSSQLISLILFIISVIFIVVIGYFAIKFVKQKKSNEIQNDEYIPQEEISEEQARQTIVSLYFTDKETGLLKPEARLVNVKELMKDPYKTLIELLINTGICSSRREVREFLNSGSISINGDKVTDENLVINKSIALNEKIAVIRKGKKKYYLVKIA